MFRSLCYLDVFYGSEHYNTQELQLRLLWRSRYGYYIDPKLIQMAQCCIIFSFSSPLAVETPECDALWLDVWEWNAPWESQLTSVPQVLSPPASCSFDFLSTQQIFSDTAVHLLFWWFEFHKHQRREQRSDRHEHGLKDWTERLQGELTAVSLSPTDHQVSQINFHTSSSSSLEGRKSI